MTNQQPYQTPSQTDMREERRAERAEFRAARRESAPWLGGAILILIGVILLLQNVNILTLTNWWALFILIPALSSFANGWTEYRQASALNAHASRSLIGAIFLMVLSFAFLFGINTAYFWPVILILGGLSLLASNLLPK